MYIYACRLDCVLVWALWATLSCLARCLPQATGHCASGAGPIAPESGPRALHLATRHTDLPTPHPQAGNMAHHVFTS